MDVTAQVDKLLNLAAGGPSACGGRKLALAATNTSATCVVSTYLEGLLPQV